MAQAASDESRTRSAERPRRPAAVRTPMGDGRARSDRRGEDATRSPARAREDRTRPAAPEERSGRSSPRIAAAAAARAGLRQIVELTGKEPEGVTAVQRSEDGWAVGVEVVEDRRIPSSSDILAVYEAELDADGDLTSYRRIRRYSRGQGGGEAS